MVGVDILEGHDEAGSGNVEKLGNWNQLLLRGIDSFCQSKGSYEVMLAGRSGRRKAGRLFLPRLVLHSVCPYGRSHGNSWHSASPNLPKTECRRMGLGLRASSSMTGPGRGVG